MNIFETIVNSVVAQNRDFSVLRPVIEKELLHHDIMNVMNLEGFLKRLTFIGGTCLRSCYNSERLSEDLDFTGGFDFSANDMNDLSQKICSELSKKYKIPVSVTPPKKEIGNTETWKFKIITSPERSDLPAQKINIDISLLPSHERQVRILKNNYNVDLGVDGVLLYAESLSEIFCDKIIAFARRPNRLKFRDLYDIHFLNTKNISLNKDLLLRKLEDRKIATEEFWLQYKKCCTKLVPLQSEFIKEMHRFLPVSAFTSTFKSELWWEYLKNTLQDFQQ